LASTTLRGALQVLAPRRREAARGAQQTRMDRRQAASRLMDAIEYPCR
jgi:hypothetical protein